MSASFLSTDAISAQARASVMKLQGDLARAQKEVASGRHADYGISLGGGMGEVSSLKQMQAWHEVLSSTSAIASARQDAAQTALSGVMTTAQDVLNQLLAAKTSTSSPGLASSARSALVSATSQLNVQIAGAFVFSGEKSAVAPISDYYAPGGHAKLAVDAAFSSFFGMAQSDAAVSGITATQMQSFLDGVFAGGFVDPAWTGNWSSASSDVLQLQIADQEFVEVGASANDKSIRQLMQAYTMVAELGTDKLDPSARQVLVGKATEALGAAIGGLTQMQARMGSVQQRIAATDSNLESVGVIITNRLAKLEQVDPYKASTEVTTIMTQLQASYAVTARLQQMSILNYL